MLLNNVSKYLFMGLELRLFVLLIVCLNNGLDLEIDVKHVWVLGFLDIIKASVINYPSKLM